MEYKINKGRVKLAFSCFQGKGGDSGQGGRADLSHLRKVLQVGEQCPASTYLHRHCFKPWRRMNCFCLLPEDKQMLLL